MLPDPGDDVRWKPQSGVIGGRNVSYYAVDGANFDTGANAFCTLSEHRTGRVRVRQDQKAVGAGHCRDFARIICPLRGLPATGRGLNHDEWCVGSKRGMDTIVAHDIRSAISARSTA